MSSSNDLELILDQQSSEFPALVKERIHQHLLDDSSISSEMVSFSGDYFWLISRQDLFIWKNNDLSGRTLQPRAVILKLPNSGLPYSSKSVVVYENASKKTPGVLVVSGEGVVRNFNCGLSANYVDTILDIAGEVPLSISEVGKIAPGEPSTFFLLTTTSGSVYFLVRNSTKPQLQLTFVKVGARDNKGIGRRLSTMFFGSSQAVENSRVIRSVIFYRDAEECSDLEEDEEEEDPLVLLVSPKVLHAFDIRNKSLLWTVTATDLLLESTTAIFQRLSRRGAVEDIDMTMLDATPMRGGILLLYAAKHSASTSVTFFLVHLVSCDFQRPTVGWHSAIPAGQLSAQYFDLNDENSYVGRIFLCVPDDTARNVSNKRTDGILIINANYVQSVYLPDDLSRVSELPLNKVLRLPTNDKLIGYGVDSKYCYIMRCDSGVSTIRLLPKGFDDGSALDSSLSEILPDMVPEGDDEELDVLNAAFQSFVAKNIVEASNTMLSLVNKSGAELAVLIHRFMNYVIDYSDGDTPVESELQTKKLLCNRVIMFLKHMNLFDKIADSKILIANQSKARTGASLLAEMCERVAVGTAVRNWQTEDERHSQLLEKAVERIVTKMAYKPDMEVIVYGKLSHINQLPMVVVETLKTFIPKMKNWSEKIEILTLVSDLLIAFSGAIELTRRKRSGIPVPEGEFLWTSTTICEAYKNMCVVILDHLQCDQCSSAEKQRLNDVLVRLCVFHLGESVSRPEGHEVLMRMYTEVHEQTAVELAERYKDFKLLVKTCLILDAESRRAKLEAYKRRFAADDFDIYLCKYLKDRKMNELLLEERGDRVDAYIMKACDGIKWRRQLQNEQYVEASHSLLARGNQEQNNLMKQKALYGLAKLAALCGKTDNNDMTDVVADVNMKRVIIKHQEAIVPSLIQTIYPDNAERPLTVSEIVELNLLETDDLDLAIEGHYNALSLLGSLRERSESSDWSSQAVAIDNVWKSAVSWDDWEQIKTAEAAGATVFMRLLDLLFVDPTSQEWSMKRRKLCLPVVDKILQSHPEFVKSNANFTKWVERGILQAEKSLKRSAKA